MNKELRTILWTAAIGAGLILGFKYLFPILTPFLLGILLACLIEPLVKMVEMRLNLNRNLAVILILIFLVILLLGITGTVFLVSYQEAQRLLPNIPVLVTKLFGFGQGLARYLGAVFRIPNQFFENYLVRPEAIDKLFRSIVSWVINFVPAFPRVILSLGLAGITAYFCSRDKKLFSGLLYRSLPGNWRPLTIQVKEEVIAAFISYIRIEIFLAILTAFLTTVTFLILKIPGAVAYGFLTGIFDFIPVVGPGLVYLPLALIFFLFQDYYQAVSLIGAYFLVLLLRQFGEARLIGEDLKVHPLAIIFLVYLGMKLFGLTGIFFGPILIIILRAVFRALKADGSSGLALKRVS